MDYTTQLTTLIEIGRAVLFWVAFGCGLLFMGLFGRRWFF